MDDDRIPSTVSYRDVPVHSGQSRKRVALVKRAIDAVHEISDLADLDAVLSDAATPPEARAFAGRKLMASLEETASSRQKRPRGIDLRTVEGQVGALSSNRWRCPTHYGSLLEVQSGLVPREKPLRD